MKRGLLAAVLLACVVTAGCGGDGAADALEQTSSNLGEIRRGQLSMELVLTPSTRGSQIGFRLEGPFALPRRRGELPRTALRYTQIAGGDRGGVEFVSSAREAWVEVAGQAYELPPAQVQDLKADGGSGGGPLAGLDVASWVREAKLGEGQAVAGQETESVRGEVDLAKAINDLLATAGELGGAEATGGLRPIEGEDAEQLERAVRSSSLEVLTGKEDRLLRRLQLDVDVGLEARDLAGGLGRLSGAKVKLELTIEKPNSPVRIESPADALPYSSLPRG